MSDLIADGATRVYFLPALPDPTAPTREQLEAGIEVGVAGRLKFEKDEQAVFDEPLLPSRTITMTIRVDTSGFTREIRRARRYARRLARAFQRSDPALSAMHADYARRRKARRRR